MLANSMSFNQITKTIGQRLAANGIHSAYIGKWHLASTPAIAQRSARAADLWEALFPTIMMGDDRVIAATYVAGRTAKAPGV